MKKLRRGTRRSKWQHPGDPSDPYNPFPQWVEHIHNVRTSKIDEYDQVVYERHGGRYYLGLFVYFDPVTALYTLYHTVSDCIILRTFIQKDAFLIGQGYLDFAPKSMRARSRSEVIELLPDWVKKWGAACTKDIGYIDPNTIFLQEESGTGNGVTILQGEQYGDRDRGNDEGFSEM